MKFTKNTAIFQLAQSLQKRVQQTLLNYRLRKKFCNYLNIN